MSHSKSMLKNEKLIVGNSLTFSRTETIISELAADEFGEMITWWRLSSRPDRIICCVFNWPVIVAARVATWRGAGGAVGAVGEGKCPSAASGNSPQWASFYAAPVQPPSLHYNLYPLHPILLPIPRAQNARSVLFCGPKDGVNSPFAVSQWPTLFQLQYRIFFLVSPKNGLGLSGNVICEIAQHWFVVLIPDKFPFL